MDSHSQPHPEPLTPHEAAHLATVLRDTLHSAQRTLAHAREDSGDVAVVRRLLAVASDLAGDVADHLDAQARAEHEGARDGAPADPVPHDLRDDLRDALGSLRMLVRYSKTQQAERVVTRIESLMLPSTDASPTR